MLRGTEGGWILRVANLFFGPTMRWNINKSRYFDFIVLCALRKQLFFVNFNRCSSEQQPLKTKGKTKFSDWNSFFDRWIHFWLDGTMLKMKIESSHILMVNVRFEYCKNSHFFCTELAYVRCLSWYYRTDAGLGSAHYCNSELKAPIIQIIIQIKI